MKKKQLERFWGVVVNQISFLQKTSALFESLSDNKLIEYHDLNKRIFKKR